MRHPPPQGTPDRALGPAAVPPIDSFVEGLYEHCSASIREIDGRPVGTGKPGPVTRKAQELFAEAVAGKLPQFAHWLDYI